MTQRTDIQIRLSLQDDASQGMRRFGETLRENSRNIRNVGLALTAMGGAAVFAGVKFAQAALEQRRALATLGSVVRAAGDDWSVYRERILEVTAALQRKTNFGDEEQQRALVILTTALGSTEDALRALPLALDASAASGKSLKSVVDTLGRALAGQTDVSISLNTQFEKGSDFSARLALGFSKVQGAAEASADPLTQLSNTMGDLQETIGEALLPLIIPLAQRLLEAAEAMGRFAEAHPALIRGVAIAGAGLLVMGVALTTIGAVLPFAITGVGLLSGAFATLAIPLGIVTAEIAVISAGLAATAAGILVAIAAAQTLRAEVLGGRQGLSAEANQARIFGGSVFAAELRAQFSGLAESIAGVGAILASPFTFNLEAAREEVEAFVDSLGGAGGGGASRALAVATSALTSFGVTAEQVEAAERELAEGTFNLNEILGRMQAELRADALAVTEYNLALRESARESLLARVATEELAFILDVESQKRDIIAQQIRDEAEARRDAAAAVDEEIAAIKALNDLVISSSSVGFLSIPTLPGLPGGFGGRGGVPAGFPIDVDLDALAAAAGNPPPVNVQVVVDGRVIDDTQGARMGGL